MTERDERRPATPDQIPDWDHLSGCAHCQCRSGAVLRTFAASVERCKAADRGLAEWFRVEESAGLN